MLIQLKDICRNYPRKKVLNGITLSFSAGKINALLGENGAGKSTLAGIICGDIKPSSGQIIIDGTESVFNSAKDAINKGIILVHQKPLLASAISVKENILLSSQDNVIHFSLNKQFKQIEQKLTLLKQQWAPSLDLNCIVKDAGGDSRFYTALLGALLRQPSCLILDEPSALLNTKQKENLYENLGKLCTTGVTVIVITHSSSEAVKYAQHVMILKDGVLYKQFNDGNEYGEFLKLQDKENLISKHNLSLEKSDCSKKRKDICLEVKRINAFPKNKAAISNADIKVNYSSITIVKSGSEGSLSTLEDIVTGMADFSFNGSIFYDNCKIKKFDSVFLRSKKTAVIPEDKNIRASNSNLTVGQILTVYNYSSPEKQLRQHAQRLIEKASVNIEANEKVSSLSGGMLQRLVIERELSLNGDLIILSHPLQALDHSAQNELCRKLVSLKDSGKAILIIGADDFPLSFCDRVYCIEDGKTFCEYESPEVKQ